MNRSSNGKLAIAWKCAAISAVMLIPCFWHGHIEAGYLGSHVYNAWLAQLVQANRAPGLWLAHPSHSVAFDWLLLGLAKAFGLAAAEKISASICVLIFFWGAVALLRAATGRIPWMVLPVLAMVSYGWTFNDGFFNYYLSIGLSFFALAIFWKATGWRRISALPFLPFLWFAEPFSLVWLLCAAVYILVAEAAPRRLHLWLCAGGAIFAACGVWFFRHHFLVYRPRHASYFFNGFDQFVLFSTRYKFVAVALLLILLAAAAKQYFAQREHSMPWRNAAIILQLCIIVEVAVLLLPFSVRFPWFASPIDFLPDQLTLISAVLICCLAGFLRPQKLAAGGLALAAAFYFVFLFVDTGVLNNLEDQASQLVAPLPVGQRIFYTINSRGSRVLIEYFVDRACVGHCFVYQNYEPSSKQFLVRAAPGNPIVMADYPTLLKMEDGIYEVQAADLPAYQIYQCDTTGRKLCIRPLEAGELNDRLGAHRSVFQSRGLRELIP